MSVTTVYLTFLHRCNKDEWTFLGKYENDKCFKTISVRWLSLFWTYSWSLIMKVSATQHSKSNAILLITCLIGTINLFIVLGEFCFKTLNFEQPNLAVKIPVWMHAEDQRNMAKLPAIWTSKVKPLAPLQPPVACPAITKSSCVTTRSYISG